MLDEEPNWNLFEIFLYHLISSFLAVTVLFTTVFPFDFKPNITFSKYENIFLIILWVVIFLLHFLPSYYSKWFPANYVISPVVSFSSNICCIRLCTILANWRYKKSAGGNVPSKMDRNVNPIQQVATDNGNGAIAVDQTSNVATDSDNVTVNISSTLQQDVLK